MTDTFVITTTLRRSYPAHDYKKMKEVILGKNYQLSLVFLGKKRATEINLTSRQKDYAPNVLSFPLGKDTGEIYLCPEISYPKAKNYNFSPEGYIAFLFIHGLLHLQGHDHGHTMESLEKRFVKRFKIS